VLATDGLDDAVLDGIVTELGQGPSAVGETDDRGRLVGDPAEGSPLVRGELRWCPAPVTMPHPVQSATVEGMEISLDRVGVEAEEACDRGGVPTFGMEDDSFGAAQLLTVRSRVQELT
jgi:hypothetical protein